MSERSPGQNFEPNQFNQYKEYKDLLGRAIQNVEVLSHEERERLLQFGYYYLEVEKNGYEAMSTFRALQDFEGLRKTADYYLREFPDSYDLPGVLTLLEDHEGMRDLLNHGVKLSELNSYGVTPPDFKQSLLSHIERFLDENKTPVATGVMNEMVDLVAIRNLSQHYDIAVPIARGGLNQGAIANLWEMPTRIVDIAAHNRKMPKGKWINPVALEDFVGKNILLFDKDAVTGSSIRQAVKMLAPFKPSSIGVYFAHNIVPKGRIGTGTIAEGLPAELKIFYPKNAPLEKAGDAYIEAHEKLGTLYGRRRQAEHLFTKEAQELQEQFPELSKALKMFVSKQLRAFDSLNPFLPGISEVREQILLRVSHMYQNHKDYLKNNAYSLPNVVENFRRVLTTTQPLPPLDFEVELIRGRYERQSKEAAQRRNVENSHYPSNPLAAFTAAQTAVKKGFDVALIIGPEGFAYEPYFRDLGLPTLAINIPESGEDEFRTVELLDNLSELQGKRVLVVEDDVHTGATLQKLLEQLKSYIPKRLGLYLGQPERFQKTINIPPEFEDTYIAKDVNQTVTKEFQEYLRSKGLKIFKTETTKEQA